MNVTLPPTEAHQKLIADLKAALKENDQLTVQKMLAVTAQLVGMLIAMQDQRKHTPSSVMAMVSSNIQVGNMTAVADLMNRPGVGRA